MPRLIVEAVSGESRFTDIAYQLELFVSITDAISGLPIAGLQREHFRLCSPNGKVFDAVIGTCTEAPWIGSSGERSGCYALGITIARDDKQKIEWIEGEYYPFGVQAFYADESSAVHYGQCVVRVQSLGR